jgi:hypothetical protein
MSRDFHQHHHQSRQRVITTIHDGQSLSVCGFSSFLRNLTNLLLTFGTDALVIMRS